MEFIIHKGRKYKNKNGLVVVAIESIESEAKEDYFQGVIIEAKAEKKIGKLLENNKITDFFDFCADRIEIGLIYQAIEIKSTFVLATSQAYYHRFEGKELVVFDGVAIGGSDHGKYYKQLFVDFYEPADVHIKLIRN